MVPASYHLAWRIARRELRGGLSGFRVFMLCLALGVAAITAVGWTSAAIVDGLATDARRLLGGDMEMRLVHREAKDDEHAYLAANSRQLSNTIRLRAMASARDNAARTLVELKAVDDAYPLVGEMSLQPALSRGAMFDETDGLPGAVVDPYLLEKLGIDQGGVISIGKARFRVNAVIEAEPDRVTSVINYGPRVMIAKADLMETGLVQPGSLIRYYYRVLFEPGTDPTEWRDALTGAFPDAGWRVRAANEAAPGVRRFIDRLTLFMSFVGYTVLLVGGVGITRAVNAYLESKSRTIATLKCMGAEAGLIVKVYMMQVLALALFAIALGLVAGIALPAVSLYAITDLLPVRPIFGLHIQALGTAAAFGLLTAVTAALWPLGRAREVPARDLFRAQAAPLSVTPRRIYFVWIGAGLSLLTGLVFLTATDKWFALWFVLGAITTVGLLKLAGSLLIRLSRHMHPSNAILRLVVANIHRPGSATSGVVLSLGLGLAVLVAVVQIEGNITRQIDERLPDEAPAYFFIDIQPHQVADFDRIVSGIDGTSDLRREPVVRGRIVEINGKPVSEVEIASESRWAVRGDRALTSTAEMKPETDIVAGKWWPADYTGPPLISLDDGLAKGFGVWVGDTLTLNILGRRITAEIASLREIDWQSLRFDFAVVLSPGVLEGAPHTHIAAVRASATAEAPLEKAITDAFDNVSAIHVREALAAARNLMEGISIAIRAVAGLTVVAGAIVLAGALAAGQQRRRFDAVVFKVLGATRKRIALTFVLEYGALGAVTAICAFGVGTLAAWAVSEFLMHMDWAWLPAEAVITLLMALLATIALGLAGSWRILGMKTAPFLRND